ncbi:MAG TPA: aldo/keto reductase [Candidatus Nitrosopolaris sp.]|nr:aldo/keto reductase [Candidatus Nitrosopolaris sp.]
MAAIGRRPLGASGIHVSELALGSWRTYERIPRDAGLAVMRKARELGINFLDDARYNDETGTAPMKSGYSEVVFGELFRATGWTRDEVVLANKLWWEFWPEQRAAAELDASLERMGMAYIDLAYAESPPAGLTMQEIVHDIGALISAGKLRAWGVLNWKPDQMVEAAKEAGAQGVPPPCAAQLAYSLVRRSPVEDHEMADALDAAHASVVASFTLDGGALTGKYVEPGATGRLAERLGDEFHQPALKAAVDLRTLAERREARPAPLAIAFALLNPRVSSVLFGATTPEQVVENVSAVEIVAAMDEETVADLGKIGLQ